MSGENGVGSSGLAPSLHAPLTIRGRTARNRVFFGPHVTNLARRHAYSPGHSAYYAARAAGGVGIIVLEEATVNASDWPIERCIRGWAPDIRDGFARAGGPAQELGATVIAAIGHAGGQGTGTFSQRPMLAPAAIPEVATREVPQEIEPHQIETILEGFGSVAAAAMAAGLDGVEVNAGQFSILRQFLSGLTNLRSDDFGGSPERRLRVLLDAVRRVRFRLGDRGILGVRLSMDEYAPWAGITPDLGLEAARALCAVGDVDYIVATSGGPYSVHLTNPGGFAGVAPRRDLAALLKRAEPEMLVFAQGGIVDVSVAEAIVSAGEADGVEMTRALIADPELPRKARLGDSASIRGCVLCNEDCRVRDVLNRTVSCLQNPAAGHETDAEFSSPPTVVGKRRLLIVGAGPAGLEAARVAADRGHEVQVWDAGEEPGGTVRLIRELPTRARYGLVVDWRLSALERRGVTIDTGRAVRIEELVLADVDGIVLATGGLARPIDPLAWAASPEAPVVRDLRSALSAPMDEPFAGALASDGAIVVVDLENGVGGPAAAEILARRRDARSGQVWLVTPGLFVGAAAARTLSLAPLLARLHDAGVVLRPQRESRWQNGALVLRELYGTATETIDHVAAIVICDFEVPNERLYLDAAAAGLNVMRAGDAVAPRRILHAILEGGRAADQITARGRAATTAAPVR